MNKLKRTGEDIKNLSGSKENKKILKARRAITKKKGRLGKKMAGPNVNCIMWQDVKRELKDVSKEENNDSKRCSMICEVKEISFDKNQKIKPSKIELIQTKSVKKEKSRNAG